MEPLSEIELELKSGEPAAIYDVALRLLDVAPLRLETRSKAERGYALVTPDGGRPPTVHVKPVILDAVMTVEGMLQSIGRSCLAHLLRNEPAALADQPEGIHQMRVAVRRLRSVLSALKEPRIPSASTRRLATVRVGFRAIVATIGGLAAPQNRRPLYSRGEHHSHRSFR